VIPIGIRVTLGVALIDEVRKKGVGVESVGFSDEAVFSRQSEIVGDGMLPLLFC